MVGIIPSIFDESTGVEVQDRLFGGKPFDNYNNLGWSDFDARQMVSVYGTS